MNDSHRKAVDELLEKVAAHEKAHGPDTDLAKVAEAARAHRENPSDKTAAADLGEKIHETIGKIEEEHLDLIDILHRVSYFLSGSGI